MKILVVNTGSSSVKFKLFDMEVEETLASGVVEKIPSDTTEGNIGTLKYRTPSISFETHPIVRDHVDAIGHVITALCDCDNHGVVADRAEVCAVGHRLVHGAESFVDSVLIDEAVIEKVRECFKFAPLHNPPNLKGVMACKDIFGEIPMVGVFDTAFHHSMPEVAYLYGLPYELYETYRLRRYGFHGTSHRYVAGEVLALTNKEDRENLRIITCHLGNGSSVAAVRGGTSVDTSMGFTPLEGLLMGTRCGDVDPAIPLLLQTADFGGPRSHREVDILLNKKSGLKGVSQKSNDLRDLHEACKEGNERAHLAISLYAYRVKKYIGAYMAVLGGCDALIFTAGIGENDPTMRELICENLDGLGLVLDREKNQGRKSEPEMIAAATSPGEIWVIPTNEELVIARDTHRLVTTTQQPC